MFYAAWGWVLPNWNFHVCHWIASHFSPPYPLKLSRVCTKRHNGKIWSINLPQQVKFTWSDRLLQLHFITQTWAFLFTNLGNLIDICFHCLTWSYCALDSLLKLHPVIISFSLSSFHLALTNHWWELHLLHLSKPWRHLDLPSPPDLTMTVHSLFIPSWIRSLEGYLFLKCKVKEKLVSIMIEC